jgi:hydrogenase maturation protease
MTPTRGRAGGRGLVVGFGNVLRSDDGVGFATVEKLEADPRLVSARESGQLTIVWAQQLTPELAVDFAAADVVVLVDANVDLAPGEIRVEAVDAGSGAGAGAGPGMTHHVDATSVAAMARDLFGGEPAVWVVGVGPESLDVGEELTPVVAAALPPIVETVVQLLGSAIGGSDAG